ncbi:MAG: DUF3833 domain-containing protein [Betaproteobacteria bacterium]
MAFAAASVLALAGCAAPNIQDYAAQKPVFELRSYFNGTIDGYGIFTDRGGKVVRRFTVVIQSSWTGDQGVLDEDFTYSDGHKEKRVWRIVQLPDGRYSGTAGDIVGQASGVARGNTLNWSYTMALPVDGRVIQVQFDDWMYLMDDKVMLNKAEMRKFGIRLGEVTLAFKKR